MKGGFRVSGLGGQPKLQLINQFRIDDICIFRIAMKNVMGDSFFVLG